MAYVLQLTSVANVKEYLGITAATYDVLIERLIDAASLNIERICGRKFSSRAYTMARHAGDGTQLLELDNWPVISVERVAVGEVCGMYVKCSAGDAFAATASVIRTGDPPATAQLRLTILGGASAGITNLAMATYTTITLLSAQVGLTAGWSSSIVSGFGGHASTELLPIPGQDALSGTLGLEVPDTRITDYSVDLEAGELYRAAGWADGWNNVYVDYTAGYAAIPDDLEQVCIQVVADTYNSRRINTALKSEKIGDYSYTLSEAKNAASAYADELAMWKKVEYA